MRLAALALALALVASPISLASASTSPSLQQLSRQIHSFKPLATGDSSFQLPAGIPQLDPATLRFIQFPNGINVILQGYGTASLPAGYPLASIPSYDAATNTITDPTISYAFAYALSQAANPSYDPNNPEAFFSGWQGGFIPGLTGIFSDDNGIDATGSDDNGIDATGTDDDNDDTATGVVLPGGGSGSTAFPTTVVVPVRTSSSTGVAVIVNPRISSTGVASGGALTGGSIEGGSTPPISNPNNPKNGAAMVASSLAMVTGLVAAVVLATVF